MYFELVICSFVMVLGIKMSELGYKRYQEVMLLREYYNLAPALRLQIVGVIFAIAGVVGAGFVIFGTNH